MPEMTTRELEALAALYAMQAAAFGDAEEVAQHPAESDAVYVARLVHYGAMMVEGK